jgi:hypothetical protein
MPTGYTEGIVNGKITTFKDFAKRCMRNFGACYHLIDENSFDYKPRIVDSYYLTYLNTAIILKKEIQNLSDECLLKKTRAELLKEKHRLIKQTKENNIIKKRLEHILKQAIAYKAPTEQHIEIQQFMVNQL